MGTIHSHYLEKNALVLKIIVHLKYIGISTQIYEN